MKKLICVLMLCVTLALSLSALTVNAIEPIEPDKACSLTLNYRHDGVNISGLEIKTYRVAEVYENGTFALIGDFANYPVNIYGIDSQAEWKSVADTLSAYAVSDNLKPLTSKTTDENGTVSLENIQTGIYLTLSVRRESESQILIFESFLTVLPMFGDDAEHNYNITAYPKAEAFTPTPDEIEFKVVKKWRDSANAQNRPESITVMIIRDGVYQSTQILSEDNNWSYFWTAPNDGSDWQVIERDVPEGYSVTVSENTASIIITNTYKSNDVPPPQTGDIRSLWLYVAVMCAAGCLLIITAIWYKRKWA